MLDVRPTLYVAPLDEQTIGPLVPVIHVENLADEDANITGLARIYRESLGTLLYTSVLHPGSLNHGQSADFSAETEFNPGAIADDDYFILAEITARSTLTGNSETVQLGQFFFDVKPAPMGPVPATHHTTHENGGMDEISVAGLSGILGTIQPVDTHATSHQAGESDAIEVANLGTAEMDDTLVLAPDGAGGTHWSQPPSLHKSCDFTFADPAADGESQWYELLFNDSTAAIVQDTSKNHPGIVRISSGMSPTWGIHLQMSPCLLPLAGTETIEAIFQPLLLDDATMYLGIFSSPGGPFIDGAYIRMQTSGITPGILTGITSSGGTSSATPSTYTLSPLTWYHLKIAVNADATKVDFYCYDESGNTLWHDSVSTNIPTTPGAPGAANLFWESAGFPPPPSDLVDIDLLTLTITRPLTR